MNMRRLLFAITLVATSLLIAPSGARAGVLGDLCSRYLRPEHVSTLSARRYGARAVGARSSYASTVLRYLSRADSVRWDWSAKNGSAVRVTFQTPRRPYNDDLFVLTNFLNVAYARIYPGGYGSRSLGLGTKAFPDLRVTMEARAPAAMDALRTDPSDGALIDLATLEATNAPVGEPTVHVYPTFAGLLDHAERMAYLIAEVQVRSLELRATAPEIKALRTAVRALISEYR